MHQKREATLPSSEYNSARLSFNFLRFSLIILLSSSTLNSYIHTPVYTTTAVVLYNSIIFIGGFRLHRQQPSGTYSAYIQAVLTCAHVVTASCRPSLPPAHAFIFVAQGIQRNSAHRKLLPNVRGQPHCYTAVPLLGTAVYSHH